MAGKTIKGITIELGGDATGLDKALSGVNKQSSSLQSELRAVERLLKLDPGNVVLVQQKQELLAESVGNTKDKLNTLEKAQEQVNRQFQEGKIDAEQYRAFQRELEKTKASLASAEGALGEFGRENIQVGDKSKQAGDKVEKAGKQAKGSGDDAKKGESAWSGFGEKVSKVGAAAGKALIGLGTAGAAAGAGVVALTSKAAYAADDINTLAKQTGLSTEEIQRFQMATDVIDVPLDTLTGSMAKLTKNMATAQSGTGTAAAAFQKLGVSITDGNGQLKNNQQVMNECFKALEGMGNETERDALAMQIFGRSAQDLNPLILGGADALKEIGDQAQESGLILSQGMLDKLNTFSDALDIGKASVSQFGNLIGTVFAEDFAGVVNVFSGYVRQLSSAFNEGGMDGMAQEAGAVFEDILSRISSALPGLLEIGTNLIVTLVEGIAGALPGLMDKVMEVVPGIVTTLLSQLPLLLETAAKIIVSLANGIARAIPTLLPQITQVVLSIVNTLVASLPLLVQAGVQLLLALVQAIPIVVEQLIVALPTIIDTILTALLEALPLLLEAAISLFQALVEAIPVVIEAMIAALPTIIDTIITTLIEALPLLLDAAIQLLMAIVDALPTIIRALVAELPRIIRTITSTLINNLPLLIQAAVQLFMGIIQAIPQITVELVKNMPLIISSIIEGLSAGIGQMAQMGLNLIKGLWQGISDAGKWLMDQISGFFGGVVDGIKKFFGIKSPSTLFRDEIGKNLALGVGEGFDRTMQDVSRQMQQALPTEFDTAANVHLTGGEGSAAGVGGKIVNLYLTITSPTPLSPYETARQLKLAAQTCAI